MIRCSLDNLLMSESCGDARKYTDVQEGQRQGVGANLMDAEANAMCLLDGTDLAVCVQDGCHGPSCSSLLLQVGVHAHQVAFLHTLICHPWRNAYNKGSVSPPGIDSFNHNGMHGGGGLMRAG